MKAPAWNVLQGDSLELLATLPERSVQACVTSPPYWRLRDYTGSDQREIGTEATFDEFLDKLVKLFDHVRRVLRDDGLLWLNMGDSHNTNEHGVGGQRGIDRIDRTPCYQRGRGRGRIDGLKHKDLIGQPWALAFALREAGWYLRLDNVWAKPNPKPESVRDRPTRAHEYVFLLSKSERCYYDRFAALEASGANRRSVWWHEGDDELALERAVWEITTQGSNEHPAVFPEELAERCILLATSEGGACAECGAPQVRLIEEGEAEDWKRACGADSDGGYDGSAKKDFEKHKAQDASALKARILAGMKSRKTIGWEPTCRCLEIDDARPTIFPGVVPCVVLDPFCGSGRTGRAARRRGRSFVGIELRQEFVNLSRREIEGALTDRRALQAPDPNQGSLFA